MTKIVPTIDRIVYFMLAPWQAEQINKRRTDGARFIHKHQWESDGKNVPNQRAACRSVERDNRFMRAAN